MKIKSITCPSCGSSLNADENETRVICSFCGCSVIVEDTKQEGYNFELGSIKARENVANQLANKINDLITPLSDYGRVSAEKTVLENQRTSLLKQASICEKFGKIIPYAASIVLTLLFLLILGAAKASGGVFIVFILLGIASFPAFKYLVAKYSDNVTSGAADTERAIEAHENTLSRFNAIIYEHRDIRIPEKYRNERALTFIRDHLKSQEAHTVEQAISQYDSVMRQEESIALQQESVRLQKEQLEQAQQPQQAQSSVSSLFGGSKAKSTVVNKKQTVIVKQHGHSLIIHLCLCCFGIGFLTIPYYTLSKHHYWHL